MTEENTEYEKAAISAASILQSDQGKILMAHLERRTIKQSNLPSQSPDGVTMAIFMGHNEGEKNLFRYIETLIKKGANHG